MFIKTFPFNDRFRPREAYAEADGNRVIAVLTPLPFPPLKIHCSEACKLLLDKAGGYTVQERGVVHIKGKGNMKTYWILGEASAPSQMSPVRQVRSACSSFRAAKSGGKPLYPPGQVGDNCCDTYTNNTLRAEGHGNCAWWRKGVSCPALEGLETVSRCRDQVPRHSNTTAEGCSEQEPLLQAEDSGHFALQIMPP